MTFHVGDRVRIVASPYTGASPGVGGTGIVVEISFGPLFIVRTDRRSRSASQVLSYAEGDLELLWPALVLPDPADAEAVVTFLTSTGGPGAL